MMDPLGFGFDHYDAVGAWRDYDGEWPIDASGELVGVAMPAPFDDATRLAEVLAEASETEACLTEQWMRFALARELDQGERCELDVLTTALQTSDGNIRELLIDIVATEAFTTLSSQEPGA